MFWWAVKGKVADAIRDHWITQVRSGEIKHLWESRKSAGAFDVMLEKRIEALERDIALIKDKLMGNDGIPFSGEVK